MRPTTGIFRLSFRYSRSDASVSIDMAKTPGAISRSANAVGAASKSDERSPFASTSQASTRLPCSAANWASAAATVVLPTPPLPVTKTSRRSRRPGAVTTAPSRPADRSRPPGKPPGRRSGGAEPHPALVDRCADLDVRDLGDRHGHAAATAVGQPEHPVSPAEGRFDVGEDLVPVRVLTQLDLQLLRRLDDPDTYVHFGAAPRS